jgi:signal transduction histidine kinase
MLFTAFDTNFTRVFAAGRILFALLCVLFATTDPGGLGFQIEFDDSIAAGWLLIAMAVAPLVWSNWWRDHQLFPYLLLLDFTGFVLVPWSLEPEILAYFVVAPLVAGHLIAFSAAYMGARFAAGIAVLVNLVCLDICIVHSLDPMGMSLTDSIRRVALMLSVTMLLLWFCRNQLAGSIGRLDDVAAADRAAALDHCLAFAMAEGRAAGAMAVWACGASQQEIIRGMGSLQQIANQAPAGSAPKFGCPGDRPTLFDLAKGHGLSLGRDGRVSVAQASVDALAALRENGVRSGACAGLHGSTGEGWLILTDVAGLSRFDLNRVEAIADRIAHSLDRYEASEASQMLAVTRLREAVARDLHDGVAQSLAGAKYWLQALRGKLVNGVSALDDLDRFAGALESEHTHIREMIDTMRFEQEPQTVDLREAVRDMAARQGQHWRTGVNFSSAPEPFPVRRELSFEIKQILRECIANSVRHGQADRITIELRSEAGELMFTIEDNGSGFDLSEPVAIPRTIDERVASLGGLVQARSGIDGTQIEFSVPVGKRQ